MNLNSRLKKIEQAAGAVNFRAAVEELAKVFDEFQKEYNSPEAVAKRQAEYDELQRIGELRRQDYHAGRNMNECHPLPWMTKESDADKEMFL